MEKKIKIFGLTYKIEEVDLVSRTDYLFGEIDYVKQTIRIDKALSKERKQQTLLHEIIHGIVEALDIRDEKVSNENVVQGIAATLHHIIVSNPTIFS